MRAPPPPLVEALDLAPADPAEVCACLLDLPHLLFLDSAAAHRQVGTTPLAGEAPDPGRFSFLTADPVRVVRSKGLTTEVSEVGGTRWDAVAGDALGAVRDLLREWEAEPVPGLPPFQGGAAGYIGYDYGAVLERLPRPRYDDLAIPDVLLGLYDWVIAWDHRLCRAWLISTGLPERGAAREQRARAVRKSSWP